MIIHRTGKTPVLKINQKNEVEYLTFPMLDHLHGVMHLISTRKGGVSKGFLGEMNLGIDRGDLPEAVTENYRRIAACMHAEPARFVLSKQTHTTNILKVDDESYCGSGTLRVRPYDNIDGLITNLPEVVLTVFGADCVPLLFYDPVVGAIGAAHSGWKGTLHKMAQKMVQTLELEYGSKPENLYCCIGPSICQSCYEISEDVAQEFIKHFPQDYTSFLKQTSITKYHLDLWKTNRIVLEQAGVHPEHIATTDICTCCNPDYLFSHRKAGNERGLLAAMIKLNSENLNIL